VRGPDFDGLQKTHDGYTPGSLARPRVRSTSLWWAGPMEREGGDSCSRLTWHESLEDKLWQPPEKPVAFSSRVKMEAWSTPGEVTSQGEACKLSTRPTLIRTRLPGICADLAGVGVRSRMGLPHTTTSYAGLLAQGRGYKCPLELPGWQAALEMKIQSRLWGPMPGSTLGDCLAFSSK
jgi:hypothetical protein